jgi:large subunit ribosomal protein L30e
MDMANKEELRNLIHSSLKAGNVVIGYNQSLDQIKKGQTEAVVVANNAPADRMKALQAVASSASAKVEMFEGDSKELGVVCGKPFPIMVLVIKSG